MSVELLTMLQGEHAFDPAPVREDLGVYHVPFSQLVTGVHPEATLLDACRRAERIAVVGDSGSGKSSIVASALGPLAPDVAPVVIPVAMESGDIVREPRAMFAHIAAVIARFAAEAEALSDDEREAVLARTSTHRPVGRSGGRHVRLSAGWMGSSISADLTRQLPPGQLVERSATETLEVVHQMIVTIQAEALVPVLVFDDTDRWLRGSAYPDHDELVAAFFGRVLPELAGLRCALVVAVHSSYLSDPAVRRLVARTLDTRIDVPALTRPAAMAEILASRVRAHTDPERSPPLGEVMSSEAVERVFEHYRVGPHVELRGVLRTVHCALADACDAGAGVITERLIDSATGAWEQP